MPTGISGDVVGIDGLQTRTIVCDILRLIKNAGGADMVNLPRVSRI